MNALVKTPEQRMLEQVNAYYLSQPHLVERLLLWLGARSVHSFDGEIRCNCPIHRGNSRSNFAVHWDRGFLVWKCYSDSCGRGDLCSLVRKVHRNMSFREAVQALASIAGIQFDGSMVHVSEQVLAEESMAATERLLGMHAREEGQPNIFPDEMVYDSMRLLGQHPDQLAFLVNERMFPVDCLAHWNIGFVPARRWLWRNAQDEMEGWFEDRISFPWRTLDGRLMGFAGRRTDPIKHMKYKTLPGTRRALMLWGLWHPLCQEACRRTKTIHLVEGYTDVMRGHLHRCFNIAAVGGTELTEQQERMLRDLGIETIVNYFDGDLPGRNAHMSIGRQVSRFARVLDAVPPDLKDPDELLSYDSFWAPIMEAKIFIPS